VSIFIEYRNEVTWISKVKIDHAMWSSPNHNLEESKSNQDQMWQPSWSKKEIKWQESVWCKLKLKKLFLYLILSIGCRSIRRDTIWIANKVSMLTLPKNPSDMSETQWPHTLTSHWTRKNKTVRFPKLECPVFPYNGYISNFRCSSF
jgi:hypothetical protein